ncbi:Lipase 2 OS=Streptomyces fumanus OX=67302 GN=GCM10018772_28230 PE=4 SV=1 [Streptomyces fumanus]
MRKHTALRVMTATAATAGALSLGLAGPAAHASTPLDYVALGDSYSAGSGVLPVDLSRPCGCGRATGCCCSPTGCRTGPPPRSTWPR